MLQRPVSAQRWRRVVFAVDPWSGACGGINAHVGQRQGDGGPIDCIQVGAIETAYLFGAQRKLNRFASRFSASATICPGSFPSCR
jgi:hypothetical protein